VQILILIVRIVASRSHRPQERGTTKLVWPSSPRAVRYDRGLFIVRRILRIETSAHPKLGGFAASALLPNWYRSSGHRSCVVTSVLENRSPAAALKSAGLPDWQGGQRPFRVDGIFADGNLACILPDIARAHYWSFEPNCTRVGTRLNPLAR